MENVPFWYASLSSAVSWNACEVAKWTHATTTASVCVFQRIESRGPCLCRFPPLFTRKESHKGCVDVSLTYSIYENYEQLLWANKHLCTPPKKHFWKPREQSVLMYLKILFRGFVSKPTWNTICNQFYCTKIDVQIQYFKQNMNGENLLEYIYSIWKCLGWRARWCQPK